MIRIFLGGFFNIFLGAFLICTAANSSVQEEQDTWRDTSRSTVTQETQRRAGIFSNPNDENDHNYDLRRGSLLMNAAHAAASAYNHKIQEPTTGGKPRTDEEPILIPKKPLFLSALSDSESHLKRLESANSCLSVTEIIGSRVLSNVFLGASFVGTILAGGLTQFYDPKVGAIVLFVSSGCSAIGTLLKQVYDTKMNVMSEMREKTLASMATQAAAEIGDLQAGHERTKAKLRQEKERKIEELKALKEAYAELQGLKSGIQSPVTGLLLHHSPSARGATPDIQLREKPKKQEKEPLAQSDSDSQKLVEKPKSKRTKKRSKLTTAASSATASTSSGDDDTDEDVDVDGGVSLRRIVLPRDAAAHV